MEAIIVYEVCECHNLAGSAHVKICFCYHEVFFLCSLQCFASIITVKTVPGFPAWEAAQKGDIT